MLGPIPRSSRARPDRTSSATEIAAPRIVSAARRYARTVYGLASPSSSSEAKRSRRSAIWELFTGGSFTPPHRRRAARYESREAAASRLSPPLGEGLVDSYASRRAADRECHRPELRQLAAVDRELTDGTRSAFIDVQVVTTSA
jgi:hypothetical protein